MVTIEIEQQRTEEASAEAWTTDVKSVPYIVPADIVQAFPVAVLPDRLFLGSLADGRLRVREPLNVVVRADGGNVVVEADEINEFGFGTNFAEALRDLQRAIVELYFRLEEEQDRLGPDLEHVWRRLVSVLQRRP